MLDIDHTDDFFFSHDRHGDKGLMAVFWKVMKKLEPWIVVRITRNHDARSFLSDPPGDALPQPDRDTANQFRMRVLRGSKNEFVLAIRQEIEKAGIRFGDFDDHFDDMFENGFEIKLVADRRRDPMEHIDFARFFPQSLLEVSQRWRACRRHKRVTFVHGPFDGQDDCLADDRATVGSHDRACAETTLHKSAARLAE